MKRYLELYTKICSMVISTLGKNETIADFVRCSLSWMGYPERKIKEIRIVESKWGGHKN